MKTTYAYVGTKSCGCMVAATVDDEQKKDVAMFVKQMITDGLTITRLPIEEARVKLTRCKCKKERKS